MFVVMHSNLTFYSGVPTSATVYVLSSKCFSLNFLEKNMFI